MNHRSAFTLIELSIVLVIIGLLIGGIVSGRELIEAAKVRKEVAQLNTITTSVNVFYDKYQMLPGDMTNTMSQQLFNASKSNSSNGNRAIEGNVTGISAILGISDGLARFYPTNIFPSGEVDSVFIDLARAYLLKDTAFPLQTVAGCTFCTRFIRSVLAPDTGIMAFTAQDTGKLAYFLGMSGLSWGDWLHYVPNTGTPALTPIQAMQIDLKIDNGLPSTGRVLAVDCCGNWGAQWGWGPQYVADGDCIVTGTPNVYNIGVDERLCFLVIRAAQ